MVREVRVRAYCGEGSVGVVLLRFDAGHHLREGEGEGWSGECGRSVPSRQIVKPARRRRTRVAEESVLGACPYVCEGEGEGWEGECGRRVRVRARVRARVSE